MTMMVAPLTGSPFKKAAWMRCPSPAGEQGGVYVDTAKPRQLQYALSKDLAKGSDDDEIRRPFVQFCLRFRFAQFFWLDHFNPQ
jgi:hypothetical protein